MTPQMIRTSVEPEKASNVGEYLQTAFKELPFTGCRH